MKRNLTENQIEFLISSFFNEGNVNGYRTIARKLIEKGKCIIPSGESIWKGGIGNFIKTGEAEDVIDCILYTFDLEYFLSSTYYKDAVNKYLDRLAKERANLNILYVEIESLV